ncbi:MAG TPA: MarR family transcriptional regulator [Bacillota bacterium]|nr:MarR family transcriptional regulator [Bacillota bacterium]
MRDELLLYQLIKIMKTFKKVEDSFLKELGSNYKLTGPQVELLWIITFRDGSTITELSQIGLWHISTVMHLVAILEENNLIVKKQVVGDKRTWQVFITPSGRQIIEEIIQNVRAENNPIIVTGKRVAQELNMKLETFIEFGLRFSKELYGENYYSWIHQNTNKLKEMNNPL